MQNETNNTSKIVKPMKTEQRKKLKKENSYLKTEFIPYKNTI